MSSHESQQQALSAFDAEDDPQPTEPTPSADASAWRPDGTGASRQCQTCDSHVTEHFARVLAGNDGVVHRCPYCANGTDIRDGAVADPEYERRAQSSAHKPLRRHQGGNLR